MENIVNCGDFNFFNEPLIVKKYIPAILCTARLVTQTQQLTDTSSAAGFIQRVKIIPKPGKMFLRSVFKVFFVLNLTKEAPSHRKHHEPSAVLIECPRGYSAS